MRTMKSFISFALVSFVITILVNTESAAQGPRVEPTTEVVLISEVEWEQLNPARGDKSPQAGTLWGDRKGTVATGFLANAELGSTAVSLLVNTVDPARKYSRSAFRTRAQIIAAACDLIGERGYEGVTTAALVERAGVSKGGLYHHFESLTDVIMAAYERTEYELYGSLAQSEPATFDEYLDGLRKEQAAKKAE